MLAAVATPTKPLAALIASELSRLEPAVTGLEEIDIEPETVPLVEPVMDVSASELVDARSDRPPPPSSTELELPFARWRPRGSLWAAAGLGMAAIASVAIHVRVAAYVVDSLAPSPSPAAIALVSIAVRAGGVARAAAPRPSVLPRACQTIGEPRVVAHRALVAGGIEASVSDGRLALGVTTSPREGRAVEVDIDTLATRGTARLAAAQPLRRVVPLLPAGDVVDAAADADDRARTAIDPQRGAISLSPARIWKLRGIAPVDAVRTAPLTSMKGYAVTFRRAEAVWLGATGGDDAQTPYAPALRLSEPGRRVGAPAVAVSGDAVVVAWAERTTETPWRIRWVRWRPGLAPESPRDFVMPRGGLGEQAMSPSVAGLGDGRVLLAWTEGPSHDHQVRAQVIGADDVPSGAAFAVSEPGLFAGQPQIALGDGRGAIAFFASRGGDLDVMVTSLRCAR